jgi:hypothetical protein
MAPRSRTSLPGNYQEAHIVLRNRRKTGHWTVTGSDRLSRQGGNHEHFRFSLP